MQCSLPPIGYNATGQSYQDMDHGNSLSSVQRKQIFFSE